jgi:hypothetical protein
MGLESMTGGLAVVEEVVTTAEGALGEVAPALIVRLTSLTQHPDLPADVRQKALDLLARLGGPPTCGSILG